MNNKLLSAVIIATMALLIIGCGQPASETPLPPPSPAQPTSGTGPQPSPPLGPQPGDVPPDEKPSRYDLVDAKDLPGLGLSFPRELTLPEQEMVIQIALDTAPIDELLKQGYTYRTELSWMGWSSKLAANIGVGWEDASAVLNSSETPKEWITYFPTVILGLGSPQQYKAQVNVAFDAKRAVFVGIGPDRHVDAPSYLKPLTQTDKEIIVAIASKTSSMGLLGSDYTTNFFWSAVTFNNGQWSSEFSILDDIFTVGIPVSRKDATILPTVSFKSKTWVVTVIVDMNAGKIVDAFPFPIRAHP